MLDRVNMNHLRACGGTGGAGGNGGDGGNGNAALAGAGGPGGSGLGHGKAGREVAAGAHVATSHYIEADRHATAEYAGSALAYTVLTIYRLGDASGAGSVTLAATDLDATNRDIVGGADAMNFAVLGNTPAFDFHDVLVI